MRAAVLGMLLVVGASPSALGQARFENIPITLEALPREATALIPVDITTDQFRARLKSGGTVQLVGNVLDLGTPAAPNATTRSVSFLAVDTLELRNDAQIITKGNPLVIFVNKLVSENGRIIAFPDNARMAPPAVPTADAPGSPGNPGNPGFGGGVVTIHVIDKMEGILHVDLKGQDGSTGGDGRTGGRPPRAGKGANAQDSEAGVFGVGICKRGGQDGQVGFIGLQGGAGGPGGDGGFFQLINIGPTPLPTALYTFDGAPGKGAVHGAPGKGGPGGQGGEGGNGSTYCSGGHGGPDGPEGPEGMVPNPPKAADGRPGSASVRNLDMEVMIRAAVTAGGVVALPARP